MKKPEVLTEILEGLDGISPGLSFLPVDGFMIASALHHYCEEDRVAVNPALLSLRRWSSSHQCITVVTWVTPRGK